ncbi:MAG: hypothetical protein HOV80_09230 [Polyangiaceae bacterium]|nr:hypothetical protein [Polyangiaceae bacterium]
MRARSYAAFATALAAFMPACHNEMTSETPDETIAAAPEHKPAHEQTASTPRTDGWIKLGQTRFMCPTPSDRENIAVNNDPGKIGVLMVRVAKGPVDLRNIVVTYDDGRTYTPHLRHIMDEGDRSYEMHLPADRGAVTNVRVDYASAPGTRGEAEIEVWAR